MRKVLSTVIIAVALSVNTLPRLAVAQKVTADGQVQKIDESAGKITLKHGPMKALNMDEPMTMV